MRELFPTENISFAQHQTQTKKSSEKNSSLSLEARKTWEYVCDELHSQLGEETCKRWIFPIRAQASNEDELILIVPSISFYQVILSDYLELIERCKNKLGFEHISIVIDLDRELSVGTQTKERNSGLFTDDSPQALKEKNLKNKKHKLTKKRLHDPSDRDGRNESDIDVLKLDGPSSEKTSSNSQEYPHIDIEKHESNLEKNDSTLFTNPQTHGSFNQQEGGDNLKTSNESASPHDSDESLQHNLGTASPSIQSLFQKNEISGNEKKSTEISSNISSVESEQETERRERIDEIVGWGKIEDVESLDKEGADRQRPSSDTLFSHTLSRKTKLNPNYTFDTFVRGPSNQFALAACYNVAENPGKTYNPLFIYGATGLGKTHLLHAVGNHIIKTNPSATVAYISSERFMNELIYCLRHNKIIDFRQKYRHCDLFLMDDIQFISGNKAATQEEFFHTFNTLYEAKKQIIITSDLFPQDIPDIEERLRNRFQWGLIADIQPPDIEHRIAILYSKAEQLGIRLSIDVAEYIANLVRRNVRELEGALHRLAAFAALHGKTLDKTLAMETFSNMISEDSSKPQMLIDAVQKVVAEHFQVKTSDLKSKRRHKALTLPRQVAMYLARKFTKTSYPEIGEKFGGKDHTTVMHAVRKITLERKRNMDLMVHLDALERVLERLN